MTKSSQIQDMMNSKRGQNFLDPLAQGKIARLEGTVGTMVPPGLPKADNLPQFSQDKSLPYRRTYISCSLSGQEALDLPSVWSPSRTYVRSGESPGVHSSATEGSITHQVFYRPDNVAFPVESGSPTSPEELSAKQKLAYYNRNKHSPSTAGVVSPVAFRKLPTGCSSLSPSSGESPVGLAIPKPVYGHSPCFADLKRTVGQNYAVERGLQRVPPQMFEDDWAAHYGHWAYLQKMEQEAMMQQRMMPFEHCGERVPLKDVTPQGYHALSPSRPRRSAFTELNHSSYIYNPAHSFVPASADQCQRFQMHPQMHKDVASLYKAPTRMHYGPTPSQVYQDRPHISKYGEIPQNSSLYCSQNSTEIYRPEDPHHINKKQTSGQCSVPQSYYGDLSHPYSIVPSSHLAMRNLPPYPGFRMHLNTSQINLLTERPCPPPVMHQVDRPLDFSIRREQNADSHREPHGQFGISGTFHQAHVSNNIGAQNCTLGSSDQRSDVFPFVSSRNYTASPQCTGGVSNKNPDLCISNNPANSVLMPKRHREESDDNGCDSSEKVQKTDHQKSEGAQSPSSPPMPVINKVFSLAPYKAYLQVAGVFSPEKDQGSSKLQVDSKPLKEEPEIQSTNAKTTMGQDDLKLKAVKTPPPSSPDSDDLQIVEVKKEKDDTACKFEMNDCPSPAISHNSNDWEVKEEPVDAEPADLKPVDLEPPDIKPAVCDSEHRIVVVKSDFEPEYQPVTPEVPEPSRELKTEPITMYKLKTVQTQNCPTKPILPPKPPIPPQTLQATFSLSKIPPHCLKLSSYSIIMPEVLKGPVPPSPEVPPSPVETCSSKSSSRQARHQFMELHQSLCTLISSCVSQTSHCELRDWLSSLDLVSPPVKTQKVSCLLGSKAREVWLRGEEMVTALKKVLCQLEHYVRKHECPFLHVIRAGAVFIPMLVVKEVLFPHIQGTFIDQVLQEHRVELRPTTLSEERHLTHLHRRAFSSKLRRLLSLKHLPDIYPDVVNLLYYTSACSVLEMVH
ncbi:uncharacterized protein C15orf39 homolog isoform X2 [Salminus brasiliensis]|uniref:uncharacterized protein C15orf39 homolog isoform X2 n=1 Tax=Salminus brasiliensis TaxID=930266 RepID=UPI003B8375E4